MIALETVMNLMEENAVARCATRRPQFGFASWRVELTDDIDKLRRVSSGPCGIRMYRYHRADPSEETRVSGLAFQMARRDIRFLKPSALPQL